MAESSINSNHWIYKSKWFLLSFYSSESCTCHLSEYIFKLFILAGFFGACLEIFPPFKQVKFEVWVSREALCDIFDRFYVWFFKMEFNPLPDLLNTEFTIIKIGLFYGDENLEAKICRFQPLWTKWPWFYCLLSSTKTCENTSNTGWVLVIFIKTLSVLPKELLINSKTRYLVKLRLRFVRFHWMLLYLLLKIIFSLFAPEKFLFFIYLLFVISILFYWTYAIINYVLI